MCICTYELGSVGDYLELAKCPEQIGRIVESHPSWLHLHSRITANLARTRRSGIGCYVDEWYYYAILGLGRNKGKLMNPLHRMKEVVDGVVAEGELSLTKWMESFPTSEVSLSEEVVLLVKLG